MIMLTLLDASRTHLIFDISVYSDADTDPCCNAAIEISTDYFFPRINANFDDSALGVIKPLTRKY